MLKGVSLSMQSLNEKALKFIKRDNIKLNTFEDLQNKYSSSNISTYTELIIGLPGETYESFIDGLCTLIERGQHHQILVYNLSVMPNSEMGNENYQKLHGIKTIDSPIFQAHSSSNSQADDIIEYEPIIITTNDMNLEDWKKSYKFSWIIQCFHTLGLTQTIAIFFRNHSNISYKNFYMLLLNFCEVNKSLNLSKELNNVDIILNKALLGKGFGQTIEEFSEIVWPIEEASYLRISNNLDAIFSEIKFFIESLVVSNKLEINENLIKDLIECQLAEVATHLNGDNFINLKYDIP
jgi:hypothetical protein